MIRQFPRLSPANKQTFLLYYFGIERLINEQIIFNAIKFEKILDAFLNTAKLYYKHCKHSISSLITLEYFLVIKIKILRCQETIIQIKENLVQSKGIREKYSILPFF